MRCVLRAFSTSATCAPGSTTTTTLATNDAGSTLGAIVGGILLVADRLSTGRRLHAMGVALMHRGRTYDL